MKYAFSKISHHLSIGANTRRGRGSEDHEEVRDLGDRQEMGVAAQFDKLDRVLYLALYGLGVDYFLLAHLFLQSEAFCSLLGKLLEAYAQLFLSFGVFECLKFSSPELCGVLDFSDWTWAADLARATIEGLAAARKYH